MFLFLMVIVSSSWLESASDECTCDDRSSDLATPSSGPTICLPFDDYLQLRQEATASAVSDEETVSYASGCIQLVTSMCFRRTPFPQRPFHQPK